MRNQHLWGALCASPEHVVGCFAAMQAQEFAYAKWSVAQRASNVSDAAIGGAFAAGTILRTHVVRPTWHFVLPAEIGWMLDLSAPRVNALNAYQYRKFDLDGNVFARSNSLLARALEGGKHLTRNELAAVLSRAGIAASGLRLSYLLMRAELDAVICSGTPAGAQHTYALLSERVRHAPTPARDVALAELTKRYFTTRGPATLKDYLVWSSLTAKEGKSDMEMIESQLAREVVDGRTYWFVPGEVPPEHASPRIDLAQGYDEYVMSYRESKDVLLPLAAAGATVRNQPYFTHAILLDGQLIGH